ncbi:MAG: helix-turn-helix transcriptional regulator [Planctomycetia bacterium]|jgi:predicted ArsR family transcriptional regulator
MPQPIPTESNRATDAAVIELLRVDSALGIAELAASLGVTATAVRQRLDRLMKGGLVERSTIARPRGRPAHVYRLTAAGRKSGGDNFRDLALVLWREIRGVREPSVRQGLLARIGSALADQYRPEVRGETVADRLESVAGLMRRRAISCGVEPSGPGRHDLPVLASYACPYPELAEEDRTICAAERLMLQDLAGAPVSLSECRLDGAACCRFTAGTADQPQPSEPAPGLENRPVAASNAERFHPVHSPARASERVI